jgi:hypothetical protein
MPTLPHQERGQAGKDASVFGESGLFRCVDRNEGVGDFETYRIAFEEVG